MSINKHNIRIDFFRSSGPGGQRKNKSETAVRITHIPTGVTVVETAYAHQHQNKKMALWRLEQKLRERNKKKKKRIPTALPFGVKKTILKTKKQISEKKKLRKKFDFSDY